ncbi:MAG TPA: cytochrome c biogenesis protein ResB [Terriglobales bacterium]|nr:cytochrome c biogenesis protein ResB [Terriglobales bacterium]
MAASAGLGRRIYQTLGSLRTGISLLIIVGVVSAAGTIVLQRPATSSADMERKYSPETLRVLDATGLTDVYHAWWFVALLGLVALSIIFASLERWPNIWRYFARPYRKPEPHFRAVHPTRFQVPITNAEGGISAAERAMRKLGLNPQRVREGGEVSLFAEKNRFALLAVYVVHASLLLIFLGGILDGVWGYRGYVSLVPGTPAINQVELFDKSIKTLPFSVRCDEAGQENYTGQFAGMPKRWWSKMTVIEDGREVLHKDIEVNDPLVYRGVRFFQSGFGASDKPSNFLIAYGAIATPDNVRSLDIPESGRAEFDGNKVRVLKFLPDAYRQDNGEVFQRSKDLRTPAVQLEITSAGGETGTVWLLYGEPVRVAAVPYAMQLADLRMHNETGLQVSYEPGQWAVWAGCVLMGIGMIISFYMVHMRFWAVAVNDGKGGLTLWVGAAANKKNREAFEQKFRDLKQEITSELAGTPVSAPELAASAAQK